jgi:hypothetical protein
VPEIVPLRLADEIAVTGNPPSRLASIVATGGWTGARENRGVLGLPAGPATLTAVAGCRPPRSHTFQELSDLSAPTSDDAAIIADPP